MSDNQYGFSSSPKKRIIIVEDHPIFRLGLAELINQEEDLFVCGEAEDVTKAWNEIKRLSPDMVIADISLKGRSGIELIKDISKHFSTLPILVLSMHDESLYAERALLAGAKGYIMKQEASESIVKAIRCVLNGKIYASERIMANILNKFVSQPGMQDKPSIDRLTDRELEVFHFIGQGLTTREIAEKLNLSKKTIGTYRERIKEKLCLKNAAELIRFAVHWVKNENEETR
ncbi:response regulator transcription factor [Desulfonema magnum]|uniref:Two component system response regulator, LuxR-type n=1 Tax=Desulfonema magnum TaxID=45655 RepID=A0A975BP02_9BACT|nr:response regulator transcription factor [Desulfonema magnum]QTA88435.1 Two component system response regulator, LuxR-type [Desulfonema magnum]